MRFTKEVEYGLICLAEIVRDDRRHSAREMADTLTVPFGILSKILQRLAAAGILESAQGPKGGYRMARDPEQLRLADIIAAVQGDRHLAACLDDPGDCVQIDHCTIRPSISRIQTMWDGMMNSMSLAEFLKSGETHGVLAATKE